METYLGISGVENMKLRVFLDDLVNIGLDPVISYNNFMHLVLHTQKPHHCIGTVKQIFQETGKPVFAAIINTKHIHLSHGINYVMFCCNSAISEGINVKFDMEQACGFWNNIIHFGAFSLSP